MDLFIATLVIVAVAAALTLIRRIELERPTTHSAPLDPTDEWSPDLPSHPYSS